MATTPSQAEEPQYSAMAQSLAVIDQDKTSPRSANAHTSQCLNGDLDLPSTGGPARSSATNPPSKDSREKTRKSWMIEPELLSSDGFTPPRPRAPRVPTRKVYHEPIVLDGGSKAYKTTIESPRRSSREGEKQASLSSRPYVSSTD